MWQELETDDATDADGVEVAMDRAEVLTWRVGARALFSAGANSPSPLTQYVTLNYLDAGGSGEQVALSGTRFETGQVGQLVEVGYGLTLQPRRSLSFYGDLRMQADVGDAGRDGWALNVGGKWAF
jgi:outer membrane autotransporter protein